MLLLGYRGVRVAACWAAHHVRVTCMRCFTCMQGSHAENMPAAVIVAVRSMRLQMHAI